MHQLICQNKNELTSYVSSITERTFDYSSLGQKGEWFPIICEPIFSYFKQFYPCMNCFLMLSQINGDFTPTMGFGSQQINMSSDVKLNELVNNLLFNALSLQPLLEKSVVVKVIDSNLYINTNPFHWIQLYVIDASIS